MGPHHRRPVYELAQLESRCLLSGVTLITHGYQLLSSDRPHWLDTMAAAIVARSGPDTTIYDLRIARNSAGNAQVVAFDRLSGPSPTSAASSNGETVFMLDWADATGLVFSSFSTASIARLVVPYLTSAYPDKGIDYPLAEGPVHLIGHSRGGSLVSSLADDLGRDGIWVDQLTTLDPHPVASAGDPVAVVPTNVIFADNYYETRDTPDGAVVAGSHNVLLNAIGAGHSDTHTWYHGTISLNATGDADSSTPITPSWYTPTGLGTRDSVGYAYSRIAGGARPADGLSVSFDGTASRVAVSSADGSQWPNIADLHLTTASTSFQSGQPLAAQFDFGDNDSGVTVNLELDNDTNPYGSAYPVAQGLQYTAGAGVLAPANDVGLSTAGIPAGHYYLMAQITDGTHTRYAYDPIPLTLTDPPPPPPPPASQPDLIGNLYSVPTKLSVGGQNVAKLLLSNIGTARARATIVIDLFASTDSQFDDGDKFLAASTQAINLAPGASQNVVFKFKTPANLASGTYHLIGVVDVNSVVTQDGSNDYAVANPTTSFTAPFADPQMTRFSYPGTVRHGRYTASVILKNAGTLAATGSYNVQVQLSPDNSTATGAVVVGSTTKKMTLKPGQSVTLKINFSISSVATGDFLLGILTYSGTPRDRDLTNNYLFSNAAVA